MKAPTVYQLRKAGHKVRVIHERYVKDIHEPKLIATRDIHGYTIAGKGGKTTVQITTNSGIALEGIAECSQLDSFDRKKGLNIAVGRALTDPRFVL